MAVGILVTCLYYRAVVSCVLSGVKLTVARCVQTISTVSIVQVYRIDRRNIAAIHKYVGERICIITACRICLLVATRNCKACVEPISRTEIQSSTTCKTVEVRIGYITLLVKIANREVIVALRRGMASTEAVLLTIATAHSLVIPIKIFGIAVKYTCIRNKLTISIEQLVVSLVVDVEIKSFLDKVVSGISISCSHIIASSNTCIAHIQPVGLHKFVGIEQVILLDTT